MELKMRQ
jgi:hypothetical protein